MKNKLNVKLTRIDGNIKQFDFETYVFGVVASEVGNAPLEACKAQAIAARTVALPYLMSGAPISDAVMQAFKEKRINKILYENAYLAVEQTRGCVLRYRDELVNPCAFSASNGGRTTSSQERWGGYRPYLIEQDDPWDQAATGGKKTGHGVGMSQKGAIYAANHGKTHEEILLFYYPGTMICKEELSVAKVNANDLVKKFKQMVDENWSYEAGAAQHGEVDCSGAFYYWYKRLGGYMYHGSNTMWREYATEKGAIKNMELLPGMAVYKCRKWTGSQENNRWYGTEPGDMYHVGLYIGDGLVIEAKGEKYGVTTSKISQWDYASKLKDTIYGEAENEDGAYSATGIVIVSSGWLNVRKDPSTSSDRIGRLYKDEAVKIIGKKDGWFEIDFNGRSAYVSEEFVMVKQDEDPVFIFTVSVIGEEAKNTLNDYLLAAEYVPEITKGG